MTVTKKMNRILIVAVLLSLFAISTMQVAMVQGAVDGTAGTESTYDKVVVTGTVTKDITDRENIFTGTYGDDQTYTLDGFALQSGEIYDSSDEGSGYGNITVNPAKVTSSKYNTSGLIDTSAYTKSGSDPTILTVTEGVTVADVAGAPSAMRLKWDYGTGTIDWASYEYTFSVQKTLDKYFVLGMYVVSNSVNTTIPMAVRLFDSAGTSAEAIALSKSASDWSYSTSTIYFDATAGNVIFVQMQLQDFDNLLTAYSLGSIAKVAFSPRQNAHTTAYAAEGSVTVDVFAFDFLDAPVKLGINHAQELTTESDYTYLNVTDPSNPDISVRQLDSSISKVVDADIDFITTFDPTSETADDEALTVSREYQAKITVDDDWADEVTLSNMNMYYVLGDSYTNYETFEYAGTEKSSLILNEGAGDAILLASVTENTLYLVKTTRVYDEAGYDLIIGSSSMGWSDKIIYYLYAIIAMIIPTTFFKNKRGTKKRQLKTKAFNKK